MKSVTSLGTWHLKSKNWKVFIIETDQDYHRDDLMAVYGPRCVIDNVERQIEGVESFCVATIRKGWKIGLAVQDDKAAKQTN